MTRILCLFSIFSLWPFLNALALTPKEAMDIRYNKALSLYHSGQTPEALKILEKNQSEGFHLPTSRFLAKHYFKKNEYSKSFRLYQDILSKIYHPKIVQFSYESQAKEIFQESLRKFPPPHKLALDITFEMAKSLYFIHSSKNLSPEYSQTFLSLAEKYFILCETFHFNLGKTYFYLGKIELSRKQMTKALSYFLESQKNNQTSQKKWQDEVRVQLAETYIKLGSTTTGTTILRSLYSDPKTSQDIKLYAQSYLKTLNQSQVNVIFNYLLDSRQNNNELPKDQYDNFEDLQLNQIYQKKDDLFQIRHFSLFYEKFLTENYVLNSHFNLYGEESLSSDVTLPNLFLFNSKINIDRYNSQMNIWGFQYEIEKRSGKRLPTVSAIQARYQHIFKPHIRFIQNSGVYKISLPYKISTYKFSERTSTSVAIEGEYSKETTNPYWNPLFTIGFGSRSEGEDLNNGTQYGSTRLFYFEFINKYHINEKWSLLSQVHYESNQSDTSELDSQKFLLEGHFQRQLSWLTGLSLLGQMTWGVRHYSTYAPIPLFSLSAGVSYTF